MAYKRYELKKKLMRKYSLIYFSRIRQISLRWLNLSGKLFFSIYLMDHFAHKVMLALFDYVCHFMDSIINFWYNYDLFMIL